MRAPAAHLGALFVALALFGATHAGAQPRAAASAPATAPSAKASAPAAPEAAPAPSAPPPASTDPTRGDKMRDYHAALASRRLGSQEPMSVETVRVKVADAEDQLRVGRVDEAIATLAALVEHPRFGAFAENLEGRAATYLLGDALATAGAYEPARGYLRKVLTTRGAWDGNATYARRSVRRLVEIAMESDRLDDGLADVKDVPPTVPEETRGEIAYLGGRAKEAHGDPSGAYASYTQVTQRSRFWAQATYLMGLIQVEQGRLREGENLFCKVADPNRQSKTTPVFADEHYFAVRDLARLALGRVAHEQRRFDDARYYYYLVPRDSDRLAEALYESATTRYEKKDYEGARELLDELKALGVHHPYEDEAWILDAYIDLAQCKFPQADQKLVTFLAKYQPVRDTVRRLGGDERGMNALLASVRSGTDAGAAETGGASVSADQMRAVAALVRLDPEYAGVARRRAILEHEASGLRLAQGQLGDLQKSLAQTGGVRPTVLDDETVDDKRVRVKEEVLGLRRQLDDLEASHASGAQIQGLRQELAALEQRIAPADRAAVLAEEAARGKDLPDLLRADGATAVALGPSLETARAELARKESVLAKDTLKRLDLRLSRLLRRARLGRIESVLGRKRALEVEIEAINNGYLPASALDSLDAARFLQDNEEYWPFEGDDWPDEYVGGEDTK